MKTARIPSMSFPLVVAAVASMIGCALPTAPEGEHAEDQQQPLRCATCTPTPVEPPPSEPAPPVVTQVLKDPSFEMSPGTPGGWTYDRVEWTTAGCSSGHCASFATHYGSMQTTATIPSNATSAVLNVPVLVTGSMCSVLPDNITVMVGWSAAGQEQWISASFPKTPYNGAWTALPLDLTEFRGHTVTVRIGWTMSNMLCWGGSFLVDGVSLNVTR